MFRRFFLPLALLAVPLAVACSVDAGASLEEPSANPKTSGDGFGETSSSGGGSTKDPTPPPTALGSPLCGVSAKSCSPDDDGHQALGDNACATPVLDGGGAQGSPADASTSDYACRVTATDGPKCPRPEYVDGGSPNADLQGVDGVACTGDSDCAPGFDCVTAGKTNVCRRYCCSGSCDGVRSQNGGPTFCDVRRVVRSEASDLVAPVCMPIKTCTLLKEGDCTDGETCAIVTDKGATGCVPTEGKDSSAKAGESCERKHCLDGHTCLGSPGDRTCYRLCKTTGGQECSNTETCTTSSAFADTSFGVCKKTQ